MKKLLLLIAVLLLAGAFSLLCAQTQVKISAGGGIGLNVSTMVSDDEDFDTDKKSRNGLMIGGVINFGFNEYVSLQPELRYSMKGVKHQGRDDMIIGYDYFGNPVVDEVTYKITNNVDYLEIPIHLKVSIPTGTLFTPDFFAGPVVGIKIGNSTKWTVDGENVDDVEDAKIKTLDIGIGFGGGGRFALGQGDLYLNFLYNLGVTDGNDDPDVTDTFKNRCLTITTGYLFKFPTR